MRCHPLLLLGALPLVSLASCAHLRGTGPKAEEIDVSWTNVAPELVEATRGKQIERGRPQPVIDGLGWVFGIPRKFNLWDARLSNHDISTETEETMERYLADNGLDHVKVRLNQYNPLDDWKRLTKNRTVSWPYRYTVGVGSVMAETLFPGRLFGGDHYNPWTATIHLYSDVPSIALLEGGRAKDFARRKLPGTYGMVAGMPLVNFWTEAIATGDAIAYAGKQGQPELEQEAYRILYPNYAAHVGETVGRTVPEYEFPIYAGSLVAGHIAGRVTEAGVSEATIQDDGQAAEAARPQAKTVRR